MFSFSLSNSLTYSLPPFYAAPIRFFNYKNKLKTNMKRKQPGQLYHTRKFSFFNILWKCAIKIIKKKNKKNLEL